MSNPAPRFQFSLADIFAALVSLAFPVWLISQIDMDEVNQPELLGILVMLGLLVGFFGAIQYRRELKWRTVWVVPAFLLCAWSIFLLPYGNQLTRGTALGLVVFPPVFAGIATGLYYSNKLHRRAIVPGFVAFFIGFIFVSTLFAPGPGFPSRIRAINEDLAVSALKTLAEAQEIYNRTDYDGDGVKEFAPTMLALWEDKPNIGNIALVDLAVAQADATTPNKVTRAGYLYRALYGQGPNAPSGAMSYIDSKGNQTTGFAYVAYPAKYKRFGFKTFLISRTGTIYSKDLGANTKKIVEAMTAFDPDPSWSAPDNSWVGPQ